jgi:hypothetical protein
MNSPTHKPYQTPKLEIHTDWKALTGAPVSVPITGVSTDPSNALEKMLELLKGE